MTHVEPLESSEHVVPVEMTPEELAALGEVPEYSDLNLQRRFRIIYTLGIVGVLLFGWLLIRAATRTDELDSLRSRNEQLTNLSESQQLLIDKLATQLDEAIDQGAVVPEPEVVAAEVPDAEVSPPVGVQGERGDAGVAGETGSTGSTGSVGLPGSVGEQGSIGPRGLPGVAGAAGAPGADGADGSMGPPGPAGTDGTDGTPGANGAPGQPGADGAPGPGPTDAQIAAAVAAYCSVPGNCTVIP